MTLHTRQPSGGWSLETFRSQGNLVLPCPKAVLTLDEIYEGAEMPPLSVGENDEAWGEEEALADAEE